MRKYFTAFIGFSFLAIVITVICMVSFKPVDSLMKPPMSGGENHDIQIAFENSINKGYKLRAPLSGTYRSSFISEDLNGDGQNEIIVLYSTEDAVDIVNISLMMKKNDEWDVVAQLESNYSEVHQVKFADVNGDDILEVLVGWTVFGNDLSRNLNVYIAPIEKSGNLERIYGCPYLYFDTVDVDLNGITDIVTVESTDNGIELSSNNYVNGEVVKQASVALDSSAYSVYSLSYDNGTDSSSVRMFVDSYKIDSGVITECVFWDSKEKRLDKIKNDGVSILSSRLTGITCQDVNADGLIDVPIEAMLDDSKVIYDSGSDAQKQSIIKWIQLKKTGYDVVTHQLIYGNNDFRITFSESWMKNITVTNNYRNNLIIFYSTKNKENIILFELRYTSTQVEEDELDNKYKFLTKTEKGKLFYLIYNSDRTLNINKVYIENTIILNGGEKI